MALLKKWRDMAYSETANKGDLQRLWTEYFEKERDIYAQLLKNPDETVKGTVKELADKYGVDLMTMVGFLDGINDSLKEQNPIEDMEEGYYVLVRFFATSDFPAELDRITKITDGVLRSMIIKKEA